MVDGVSVANLLKLGLKCSGERLAIDSSRARSVFVPDGMM
jgi:hypothetical protein